MKPYRTVISVPGHKPSWFDKAVAAGADCLCLDLEDSVPEAEKDSARQGIAEAIGRISASHPRVGLFVRPNALDTGETGDDLAAVIVPGISGVFAPKVGSAIDVHKYDALVDYFERRNRVTGIEYILPIETIEGIQHCEEIGLASPRVGALIGPTAEHADIARAIGYEWSPEGTESRYHRSRILLAARAAGVQAIDSVYSDVADMDGLLHWGQSSRGLGFEGMGCIHPLQIPVVHQAYAPPAAEIEKALKIVAAYEDAEKRGLGVVSLGSKMIDPPVVNRALKLVARAREMGLVARDEKERS